MAVCIPQVLSGGSSSSVNPAETHFTAEQQQHIAIKRQAALSLRSARLAKQRRTHALDTPPCSTTIDGVSITPVAMCCPLPSLADALPPSERPPGVFA